MLARTGDRMQLSVQDDLDRAWRRVGLSLDRIGFTVEDRDRSKGIYYVRYIDPDIKDKKPGFFARLFGAKGKRFRRNSIRSSSRRLTAVRTWRCWTRKARRTSPRSASAFWSLLHEQLK